MTLILLDSHRTKTTSGGCQRGIRKKKFSQAQTFSGTKSLHYQSYGICKCGNWAWAVICIQLTGAAPPVTAPVTVVNDPQEIPLPCPVPAPRLLVITSPQTSWVLTSLASTIVFPFPKFRSGPTSMARQAEHRAARKACRSCATAKVRCTWSRGEAAASRTKTAICDRSDTSDHGGHAAISIADKFLRCARLEKSCTAQVSSAKAAPVPRT